MAIRPDHPRIESILSKASEPTLYPDQFEWIAASGQQPFVASVPPTQTPEPCALYNYGDTEALALNMPSPAWSAEDPDDHPVLDWKDPEDWPQPVKHTCPGCHGTGNADLKDGGCVNCGGKGFFYGR